MKTLLLLIGAVVVLLAGIGCELTPAERFEPELNIHCLLIAGRNVPTARVNRTYAIDEEYEPWLDSVDIRLWRGEESWSFYRPAETPYPSSYWCDDRVTISPHDTFSIRVTSPGFDTVFGTTVVPDTFSFVLPENGDTVTIEDSLIWRRSAGCKGYYSSLEQVDHGDTFYITFTLSNESMPGFPYDTLNGHLPLYFLSREQEGVFKFHLLAVDTNYFDWIASGGFGFGTGVPVSDTSRLLGGVGVFGSASACSLSLYLKHEWPLGARPGRYRPPLTSSLSSMKSYPVSGRPVYPPTSSSDSRPGRGSVASATGRVSPAAPPDQRHSQSSLPAGE